MISFASLNYKSLTPSKSMPKKINQDFDEKYHYVSAGTNHKPKQIMTINWPIPEKLRIL